MENETKKVVKKKSSKLSVLGIIIILVMVGASMASNFIGRLYVGTFGTEATAVVTGYTSTYTLNKAGDKVYSYTPIVRANIDGKEIILNQSAVDYNSKDFGIGDRVTISHLYKDTPIFIIRGTFFWTNMLIYLFGGITGIFLGALLLGYRPDYKIIDERKRIKKGTFKALLISIIPLGLLGIVIAYKVHEILVYPAMGVIPLTQNEVVNTVTAEFLFVCAVILYIKVFIDCLLIKKVNIITLIIAIILIVVLFNPLGDIFFKKFSHVMVQNTTPPVETSIDNN